MRGALVRWTAWILRVLFDAVRLELGPRLPAFVKALMVTRQSLAQPPRDVPLRSAYDLDAPVSRRDGEAWDERR
jgi:hypothetical protein